MQQNSENCGDMTQILARQTVLYGDSTALVEMLTCEDEYQQSDRSLSHSTVRKNILDVLLKVSSAYEQLRPLRSAMVKVAGGRPRRSLSEEETELVIRDFACKSIKRSNLGVLKK